MIDAFTAAVVFTFQSTRPARGATGKLLELHALTDVSIHAPRAGRDQQKTHWITFIKLFQSTRPARGATIGGENSAEASVVSIHAPRAGRDQGPGDGPVHLRNVSIHAPRAGRDNQR